MSNKDEQEVQQEEILEQNEEVAEEEYVEEEIQQETIQNNIPQPLPSLSTSQLSKEELAYGCTFFSNAHGYTNPLNVVTPKALQTRFAPIQNMSLHAAETLLRPPFKPSTGRNFAESKQMKDLQLQCLAPCEIQEIMDYRVGAGDKQDAALESFKLLGAKDEHDKVHVNQLAALLVDCYQNLDYQLSCVDDYQMHCKYIQEQLEQMEKKNPELKLTKKKEQPFKLAPEEDIVAVIKMSIGDKDYIYLDDWRSFFKNVSELVFQDYRKQIERK
ncbi:Conserved_hypothetical protein [Hexamita inflata]|uniref:Uncharacterized protein n=1 Tax=Hexamita inflata TaxID=28002 RepID=A0AA86R7A1_9EUKA|nr:Conserved hypothetical protein [Hexamita inflata]CAI9964419.1 Conserved hypothetical protein [Hexamita inflata]CAI9973004.1 Conserved hypothetical protein [Hexamita inflata]